jgi:acyl-CoA synthetase (AMP-forming)/AMP-acid ligase II
LEPTILARMCRHTDTTPNKVIYVHLEKGEVPGNSCTFAQLRDRVFSIANTLIDLGYRGERAVILDTNPLRFVQTFLGCLAAGVIAVPVAVPSPKNAGSVAAIAHNAQIRCVLAGTKEQRLRDAVCAELGPIPWHDFHAADTVGSIQPHGKFEEIAYSRPEQLAFLQYTSGSTGMPKGVMISHRSLMANEAIIGDAMRMHHDSVVIGWLPHYHDMGLIGNLLQTLYQGCQCVLMQPTDFIQKPVRWLRAVSTYRGTVSGGPNFAYDLCVTRVPEEQREGLELSSWEVAFTGAEPVKSTTISRFNAAFGRHGLRSTSIFPCYGMAESTLFISGVDQGAGASSISLRRNALSIGDATDPSEDADPDSASFVGCGLPHDLIELTIVHPETRNLTPEGCVGEIWIHGASVADGYFNNQQATSEAFAATVADQPGKNYFRTGDLGVLRDGHLIVVGRLKDTMIIRGKNVYPQDVESTVQLADPALVLGGGCVFQGNIFEERVVLVQELTRDGLREYNLSELISKIGEGVIYNHGFEIGEVMLIKPGHLPRTTSGKVRRSLCRELYERGEFKSLNVASLE